MAHVGGDQVLQGHLALHHEIVVTLDPDQRVRAVRVPEEGEHHVEEHQDHSVHGQVQYGQGDYRVQEEVGTALHGRGQLVLHGYQHNAQEGGVLQVEENDRVWHLDHRHEGKLVIVQERHRHHLGDEIVLVCGGSCSMTS